jgi:hypothetical protein
MESYINECLDSGRPCAFCFTIGALFYNQTPAERNRTIVHEVLHLYYSGNHEAIMKGLGFGDYTDGEKASKDLEDWLKSDCTTSPKP